MNTNLQYEFQLWMTIAACRNESVTTFFPTSGAVTNLKGRAHSICRTCPVRAACLEYALSHRINYGIWGNTSERERKAILKSRRLALLDSESQAV